MSEAAYLLIIDYNLSRQRDVRTMASYARQKYGLETILIKRGARAADRACVDHVLDIDHAASNFIARAEAALTPYRSRLRAGLVFSDDAVAAGAELLDALGLKTDDPRNAKAAFSKIAYREAEALLRPFAAGQNLFLPRFAAVTSAGAAQEFFATLPSGAMIMKPACEGNNRGVVQITHCEQIQKAWEENAPYADRGIICEELIAFPEEYSFDGVGQLTFITRKLSVKGEYPVEKGQIVSAHIDPRATALVRRAGLIANIVSGQYHGPFHSEIKIDLARNLAAIIEPNRRPAGMRIWDLAERVYGINFYHVWVDHALDNLEHAAKMEPRGSAFTLALALPHEGVLDYPASYDEAPVAFGRALFSDMRFVAEPGKARPDLFGFEFLGPRGSERGPLVKTNADFAAVLTVWVPDTYSDTATIIARIEHYWQERGHRYIERRAA